MSNRAGRLCMSDHLSDKLLDEGCVKLFLPGEGFRLVIQRDSWSRMSDWRKLWCSSPAAASWKSHIPGQLCGRTFFITLLLWPAFSRLKRAFDHASFELLLMHCLPLLDDISRQGIKELCKISRTQCEHNFLSQLWRCIVKGMCNFFTPHNEWFERYFVIIANYDWKQETLKKPSFSIAVSLLTRSAQSIYFLQMVFAFISFLLNYFFEYVLSSLLFSYEHLFLGMYYILLGGLSVVIRCVKIHRHCAFVWSFLVLSHRLLNVNLLVLTIKYKILKLEVNHGQVLESPLRDCVTLNFWCLVYWSSSVL